jgi:hypothetical protein
MDWALSAPKTIPSVHLIPTINVIDSSSEDAARSIVHV